MHEQRHEPREEYEGPATIRAEDSSVEVTVTLRGRLEPIDGRFHWYGRVAASPELDASHSAGDHVTIATAHGTAAGRISDLDPWGRFRIAGTGRPPF
ncbi:MAG: DUF4873 domain-containing protein [Marmoricola sp.]